jgi:hypothetical protein
VNDWGAADAEENPLYVHDVFAGSRRWALWVTRRVKATLGQLKSCWRSTEKTGRGLRFQRLRERSNRQALNSPRWLRSFHGKSFDADGD